MNQHLPVIAIVGPTAVGKTGLSLFLSQHIDLEVLSVDSRQVYRKMDIGTAKATPEEQAVVPHHLIDIADPDETIGLAQFLRLARAAIDDITARGKVPFLVGGTGQYIRALLKGWQVPEVAPDPDLRAQLEARAEANPQALWQQLMALDPDAEAFMDARNIRRVIRALEVCLKSGRPFSAQRQAIAPAWRSMQLGVNLDREALYARADRRVMLMMAAGLEAEVKGLLAQGYAWDLPSMSALGYVQFRPYVEGEVSLTEVAERIQLDTHDFIRRQYAWFSPNSPTITWVDSGEAGWQQHALTHIKMFLDS